MCKRRPMGESPPGPQAGRAIRTSSPRGDNSMNAVDAQAFFWSSYLFFLAIAAVLVVAGYSVRIAKEYERGVVFRLGRMIPLKGPGLFFVFPLGIDRVRMVDLRVITLEVPPQEVITSDNVTVKVNAVIFFQVVNAQSAIIRVNNFVEATSQIAQ